MHVEIRNREHEKFDSTISLATPKDLDKVSDNWKFNWSELSKENSIFYKLTLRNRIQGLIKIQEENGEYFVLKNIEVSPSNYGSKGKYKGIAEALMAFACLKSFELNKGNYRGFLVFISKGTLIEYYQKKYNAELIFRERMIITPQKGKELILKYLKISLE